MFKNFDSWQYYSFGKEQYRECMEKIFINNMNSLRQANLLVVVLAVCFAFLLAVIDIIRGVEINYIGLAIFAVTALFAFLLSLYVNYRMQTGEVPNRSIYKYIILFYINIIAFGLYLCVWMYPHQVSAFYLAILICALLMFVNPPIFNLCLTLGGIIILCVCSVLFKTDAEVKILDILNTLGAGILSLYFSWHITKLRMGMEMSANILEDERNKYLDQSIIDELTKLNNRRDFMSTFKRYVNNYRTSDDFLCIAISDIDFFKNYNDHYGHPQGDECLRTIGAVFNQLKETMGVYAARVGGEEFGMLWFEKDASHVDAVVSYLSSLVRSAKVPHEKSKVSDYVTMSVGVYIEKLGASHDVDALYELADNALYMAKGAGRNCAIISGRDRQQYKITPPA